MPKIVDASEQRREILDAARGVFARRGLEGTGLSHVAAAAGMGRSSLYHYFRDKGTLVRALIRAQMAEEEALFALALAGGGNADVSALGRIEALVAGQVEIFEDWRATAGLTLDLWSRHAKRFRPFFRSLRSLLGALIEEGQEEGEIDGALDAALAAACVIGLLDGLLLQYVVEPAIFTDRKRVREALVTSVRKQLAS